MKYSNILYAVFISRPNRFEAYVDIEGECELVHVKNTGRCKEILVTGAKVVLSKADNPARKTKYDLIAAYTPGIGIINIDSQAPNAVAREWLNIKDFDYIKPEYKYGDSRIDFYMEKGDEKYLMEVKGCTLEKKGIGYFPDAPTQRGVKHINELIEARKNGYNVSLCFVIGMNSINEVRPNIEMQPEFGEAFERAKENGVRIVFLECRVTPDEFKAIRETML